MMMIMVVLLRGRRRRYWECERGDLSSAISGSETMGISSSVSRCGGRASGMTMLMLWSLWWPGTFLLIRQVCL